MTSSLPHFLTHYIPFLDGLETRRDGNASRVIVCTKCKHTLGHQHNILHGKDNKFVDEKLSAFISTFCDPFWKDYSPSHGHVRACTVSSLPPEEVAMEPLVWMLRQGHFSGDSSGHDLSLICKKRSASSLAITDHVNSNNHTRNSCKSGGEALYCPQCGVECGRVRVQSMFLCLRHILVDSFVLHKESFRTKRLLNLAT